MAGIDRKKVNKQSVSASDPQRSGFDLSYNSYSDFVLGLAHVSGVQHVMPGTKFSGQNKGRFTLNNISTPFVTPIDATQFNVVVSLRSIDNSFEDAFAPSKNNSMSDKWRVPTWNLRDMVHQLFTWLGLLDAESDSGFAGNIEDLFLTEAVMTSTDIGNLRAGLQAYTPEWIDNFASHYMDDARRDYQDHILSRVNGLVAGVSTFKEARYAVFDGLFTPIFGEGSLIDELGYIKLRRYDIKKLADKDSDEGINYLTVSDFLALIDDTLQSEYALRAYYAAWYELMREPTLEPVSTGLPKWKHFGSASVCDLPFFFHRFRAWYDDMYTTAQVDDMMRHVYAPIFVNTDQGDFNSEIFAQQVSYPSEVYDYTYSESNPDNLANQHNLTSQTLTWRDPVSGAVRQLACPLPAMVHDSLRSTDSLSEVYGLDLLNLRQAQSLERYLKRNFYFGDEYKDRMLAHYGSEVSDYRLNRPTILSSSINALDQKQEIANLSTEFSDVGDRVAVAEISSDGDGFESFAEEFSIVLNLISFMPRPQYAGVLGHNLLFRQIDFPVPEFAANNEELSRIMEIAVSGLAKSDVAKSTFGHHPYAHIWRSRVDEVHGSFLSARRDYTFARFFGAKDEGELPFLNYEFIHCRPSLGMFVNQNRLDGQLYGRVTHEFYSECPLPVPVENI